MTKSAFIRARVEPKVKQEAEKVLDTLGMSTSEAITVFLRQVALHKGIPFSLRVPNKETAATLKVKRFSTYADADTMLDELWPKT